MRFEPLANMLWICFATIMVGRYNIWHAFFIIKQILCRNFMLLFLTDSGSDFTRNRRDASGSLCNHCIRMQCFTSTAFGKNVSSPMKFIVMSFIMWIIVHFSRNFADMGWDVRVAHQVYRSFHSREYLNAQKIR